MLVSEMPNGIKVYKMEEEHIREAIQTWLELRYGDRDTIDPDSIKLVVGVEHSKGSGTGTTIRGIATSKGD